MKLKERIKTKWFQLMERIELRIFNSDSKWLRGYIERSQVSYEELRFIARELTYLEMNKMKDQSLVDQLRIEFRYKFKEFFHLT